MTASRRQVTFGTIGLVVTLGAALLIGTRPLSDNSFFTHLTTGRLIFDTGHIPRSDPYSYTAPGTPWVVQSWLASVLYAGVDRWFGALGLRLLYAGLTLALGALLWRVSRPADGILVRLGLVALALGVGADQWAERPFMIGCVLFGVFYLAAEQRLPAWVLVVGGWVWVNSHGSFPLGIVLLVCLALGRRLDGERPELELRALRWAALGMVLGALNPLGPQLLIFPVHLLQRQDILREVIEWQAPAFTSPGDRAFLLLVVVAVLALVRRPTWRAAVPVVVFTVAALLGTRNMVLATIVLVGSSASALAGLGSLRVDTKLRLGAPIVAVLVALVALISVDRLAGDDFAVEERYPVAALALLEDRGVDLSSKHLVSLDYVGNLLTFLHPHGRVVYFDDRYDMYPVEHSEGNLELLRGRPGWAAELRRVDADIVIWDRSQPLSSLLALDPEWRPVLLEERWVTYCRRGSDLPELGC